MQIRSLCVGFMLVASALAHAQNADPEDVEATISAVKAANPDMRALCQKGPDAVRSAVGQALATLVPQGKLKGNPQDVGNAAGQRLGRECRGG